MSLRDFHPLLVTAMALYVAADLLVGVHSFLEDLGGSIMP